MGRVLITEADIDIGAELTRLEQNAGAVASFLGVVRAETRGRRLEAMTLEHYPGMTERAIEAIAADAIARWRLIDHTIIHRVGRLTPGARIVLVAASSLHRRDALEATQFLIDWLKTDAPFWKREEFTEGDAAWVAARTEDDAARDRWHF